VFNVIKNPPQTSQREGITVLNVNETIIAYDVAEALTLSSGIFEVKRGGQTYRVVSRAGHSITNFRPVPETQGQQSAEPWRIKKIAELRSETEELH
jgi:hypothetical protein